MIPTLSHLVESAAGAEPLSPAEIAEMKEHLAFLRAHRDVLRLRLNAAEDLLVNGQREPTDRGVCRHLLGKVDRGVIEAATGREPLRSNPAARARMLAGAIRLTADIGVLLLYLETLAHVRSHAEAAQAFAEVVERIDFESLSATRIARLLQVLLETFVDHERVQVLFSLLAQDAFRRAFDAASPALPPETAAVLAPLRAVHARLHPPGSEHAGTTEAGAPAPRADAGTWAASSGVPGVGSAATPLLAAGIEQVLSAPDPVLRGYAEPLRIRLLELALESGVPAALGDRAAGVLLSSLAHAGRAYSRLATRRAASLLQRHADDRARAVLEELRRAQPGFRLAERWLAALAGRRLGRIALEHAEGECGRLVPGFWLDHQRPVWVRTAAAPAAERIAAEARLHADLALPCVAPLVAHGVASGIPYAAVTAPGRPLASGTLLALEPAAALAVLGAMARALRALALAGVRLPDAAPERFLHLTHQSFHHLTLADMDGAEPAEPDAAHRAHAAALLPRARWLFAEGSLAQLGLEAAEPLRQALDAESDLVALVAAIDRAALCCNDRR